MKRTTLVLEEGCLRGIRVLARREGRHMSQIVNEILADGLRRRTVKTKRRVELPSFDMGRTRVDVADRDALEAVMTD